MYNKNSMNNKNTIDANKLLLKKNLKSEIKNLREALERSRLKELSLESALINERENSRARSKKIGDLEVELKKAKNTQTTSDTNEYNDYSIGLNDDPLMTHQASSTLKSIKGVTKSRKVSENHFILNINDDNDIHNSKSDSNNSSSYQ